MEPAQGADRPVNRPPSLRRWLLIRLVASLAVGLLVAGMSLICAWRGYASFPHLNPNAATARQNLHLMRSELDDRIGVRAALPHRLDELEVVTQVADLFPRDSEGNVLDPWGQPYRYEPRDGTYTLVCYGRDGKPGGAGSDTDFTGTEPPGPLPPLTLSQFVHDPPTNQMIWAYLISAVSAAGATCVLTRNRPTTSTSAFGILVAMVVTAGSAVFAAFIMSLLHIPNYHKAARTNAARSW